MVGRARRISLHTERLLIPRLLTHILICLLALSCTAYAAHVRLEWDAVPQADGYRVHYGKSSGTYTESADAGNNTSYTVNDLEEGETYYFAVTAYNNTTTSPPSDEVSSVPTPDGGGSGSGCSIATAAFGSPLAPEVQTLQAFRDTYLLTNSPGRLLVAIYYRMSPPCADYLRQHEQLKIVTRHLLVPLVYAVKYPRAGAGTVGGMLLLALLGLKCLLLPSRISKRGK
jgi:Fibronectin type III domain